ncbi:MAG TPA: hypothetical protein VK509_14295 [Polyangiales bacterium]|nr:hypothetical protein [Polyangiales bacterium]
MPEGRLILDSSRHAGEALARGHVLAASTTAERPVVLYAAPLELSAVVLGAYQHAGHALRREALDALALPVLRRRTGGSAVWAGDGLLYLALGLHDASALMACPPGKILNRNVRGLLAGARSLGVPTHYFGRDFVSFATDPGAYIAWDEAGDGRVLIEAFVALETSFSMPAPLRGYPAGREPPLRGKTPTTLRNAGATQPPDQVLAALADGYGRGFAVAFSPDPPNAAELSAIAALRPQLALEVAADAGLCWAAPLEEAIGFISAGARLDAAGRFAELALGGDLLQHRDCPAQLRAALIGREPEPERIGAALDQVYAARPGLIEGVRTLGTLRAALLDAAGCARA